MANLHQNIFTMLQNDKKSNVIIERILQYIQYLDISESKFSIKMGKDRSFVSLSGSLSRFAKSGFFCAFPRVSIN